MCRVKTGKASLLRPIRFDMDTAAGGSRHARAD